MPSFQPVFTSLLETDLYKFSMLQALLHAYPANQAEYRFMCRTRPEMPLAELHAEVSAQLDHLCSLHFAEDELEYLRTLRYLKSDFIDYLSLFQLQRRFIEVGTNGDELTIVARGPQIHVMLFEIFVLAIVNELYFRRYASDAVFTEGRRRLQAKIDRIRQADAAGELNRRNPFQFFDFGLRRRFSGTWHDEVIATLGREIPTWFRGTSNVWLARKHNLAPIGTMAHEYMQTFQAVKVQLRQSQKAALEAWVQEFRGDLGVALTDVVGMDAFLADFDLYFAKLFDGLRHDSGDPIVWGEKALAHYAKLRVDTSGKRMVFSDGLNIEKAFELYAHFADRAPTGFGIGTTLTNDLGPTPLNIVMKLVSCNHQPVAKLSDSPGKTMCSDETFLAYLRQVFNVKAP